MQRLSETIIVSNVAERLCQRITRSTVRALQSLDTTLSGEDSGLGNVWDEVCVQVQCDHSIYWDTYEMTIEVFVVAEVEELKQYELGAIWLQTPEGFDWSWEDVDDRDPDPVISDHVVDYIISDYVLPEADRWSNLKIRAYAERYFMRD